MLEIGEEAACPGLVDCRKEKEMCWWTAGGFGWWWLAPVFMALFFGLVVWVAVALIRALSQSGGSNRQR